MSSTLMLWQMFVLGQAPANPAAAANQVSATGINSVWDFVVKGGWMMIPIGLCSLIALSVILERVVTLRRRNIIPASFLPGLKKLLEDGEDDRSAALDYCRKSDTPIAGVFAAAIKKLGEPLEILERHIQEAGERAALKLRKYLRLLSVVASIAPLMGLLGTIFGMIIAFQTVATSGEALGKAELLAKGIYQAMITTAAGLMLAIPVLVAYHWISAKIEYLVSEIDLMTVDFVEEYADQFNGHSSAPKLAPADDQEDVLEAAAETA